MKYNKERFISKAQEIHGNRYDYSKVEYVNSTTKVCIICPEHGEFWQTPAAHLRGDECPKCANIKKGKKRMTKEEFIERGVKIHNNRYDYSKVEYVNSTTKVCIICPEHGEFWQTPLSHIYQRSGCPKCVGKGLTKEELILRFKKEHGNVYDYSRVEYVNSTTKVCIICPEHGEFWQTPQKHILGQGCPKCGRGLMGRLRVMGKEEFIRRAIKVHGDNNIYTDVDYINSHEKIKIICKKHGEYWQRPYDHLNGHGCPHCANIISHAEIEIYEFLCDKIGEDKVFLHNRGILPNNQEIDIFIPSLGIGIEYNGLRWHSEAFGKTKFYHLNKTLECEKKGIKMIQIFEDEYNLHKDIVLNKLSHLIGEDKNLSKIMGRKVDVKEIKNDIAYAFLDKNHIQGRCKASYSIGAYFMDRLIGVMCFTKDNKEDNWVLSRFATDNNYICCGVGGKLFSYFVKKYNPTEVKSFADRRWTINKENIYTKIGFHEEKILGPEYRYVDNINPLIRIHKFNLRKKELHRKYNFSMDMTEKEMVQKLNLTKIWDCGLIKYVWKNKKQ